MKMKHARDDIDQRLLNGWQRGFPLVPQPFAEIGRTMGLDEAEVIARLEHLKSVRAISRVGATVRPNTIAASTLAAIAIPDDRIEEVAAIVGAEEGVNHSYLREHKWNLWFVATAPDADSLAASLARIRNRIGLEVLDLPLLRAFNIDLGFSLDAQQANKPDRGLRKSLDLNETDRAMMQVLAKGLQIVPRPFRALANDLAQSETSVISRIQALSDAGYLNRIGVIVRHRALGWSSNAMVVWQVPVKRIADAGKQLATLPGITLCYQRKTLPDVWPFTLYSMIHARSRKQALETLAQAKSLPEMAGVQCEVLFSNRCFKQTGAMIAHPAKVHS